MNGLGPEVRQKLGFGPPFAVYSPERQAGYPRCFPSRQAVRDTRRKPLKTKRL